MVPAVSTKAVKTLQERKEERKQWLKKKKIEQDTACSTKLLASTRHRLIQLQKAANHVRKTFPEKDKEAVKNEVSILRRLHHQNIVSFIREFTEPEQIGFEMEHCARGSLEKIVYSQKFVYSMDTVLSWLRQIFEALAYLCDERVLHNNICLENILVTEDFELKLGGFGCSEEMEGPENDNRSDVYSAGLVMWELIERRQPFQNAESKINVQLETPNVENEKLKNLIKRCTSNDRENRLFPRKVITELASLKKAYEGLRLSLTPIEDPNQSEMTYPIGFNNTVERVPIPQQKNEATNDRLTLRTSAESSMPGKLEISLDPSIIDKLVEEKLRKQQENICYPNENTSKKIPLPEDKIPVAKVTFGEMLQKVKSNRNGTATVSISQSFQVSINGEELKKQMTIFQESLLLLASCAQIKVWPSLLKAYDTCLRKLLYLHENLGWGSHLTVFFDSVDRDEWYHVAEIPADASNPFSQNIFINRRLGVGKLVHGVWAHNRTTFKVFGHNSKIQKIELYQMHFGAVHGITKEWIQYQIEALRNRLAILISSIFKKITEGSKPQELQPSTEPNDSQEIFSSLQLVDNQLSQRLNQSLLSYYGWTQAEFNTNLVFYNKLVVQNLTRNKLISNLCQIWNLRLEEIFQIEVNENSEQILEFWACDTLYQGTVFVLGPRPTRDDSKALCFTNNWKFTEIQLSTMDLRRKDLNVSHLDKELKKKLDFLKNSNHLKAITVC